MTHLKFNECQDVIIIIIFLAISISLHAYQLPECDNSDECGKIIGWLVDSDTNQLIEEEFALTILFYNPNTGISFGDYYALKTKTGKFSIRVKPGQYVIAYTPYKADSKYPHYFDPHRMPKSDEIITVEKGKITETKKRLNKGSELRIIITDSNGQKINFKKYFENGRITIYLNNDDIGYQSLTTMTQDELQEGETIITNIPIGRHRIHAYFRGSGYGKTKDEYILIVKNNISEYKLVIDPFNNTGIQGFITDQNGIALKDVEVTISKKNDIFGLSVFADTISDDKGYYKIIALEEGVYMLRVACEYDEFSINNIIIEKNVLLEKNIKINTQKE